MTRALYALLAAVAGGMLAVQAPINARLRTALDSPVGSAVVSFVVGLAALLVVLVVMGHAGRLGSVGSGPWWAYLGGPLGAVFVMAGILATPRVGVTVMFVAVILGQIVTATLVDRFGWLGVPAVAITWERVAAIGLMVAALVLLLRRGG